MTEEFSVEYLARLARIETPGSLTIENSQACYNYCQVRNMAKDLLIGYGDKRTAERLSKLILKLGIGLQTA